MKPSKATSSPRTASSSYIDPKTDPDRPSLATAAVLSQAPVLPPHHKPGANPLLPAFPAVKTPKQATDTITMTTRSTIAGLTPYSGAILPSHGSIPSPKLDAVPSTLSESDVPNSSNQTTTALFDFSPISMNSVPVPHEDRRADESFQSSLLRSVLSS